MVETRILAKLRNRRFFSLAEVNEAIADLLEQLNARPFQKLPGSRLTRFQEIDVPALGPLPKQAYTYAEWKKARAGIDYHVSVEKHYYSVPYAYIKKQLDVCVSERTVEIFYKDERIASHARAMRPGAYTTIADHMPRNHRLYAEWRPERIISWAAKTGESTAEFVEKLLEEPQHAEHGYRAAMGIMRLGKNYGPDRLEAACQRALVIGAYQYRSVKSILEKGLDQAPLPQATTRREPIVHANIRGADYYN